MSPPNHSIAQALVHAPDETHLASTSAGPASASRGSLRANKVLSIIIPLGLATLAYKGYNLVVFDTGELPGQGGTARLS